MPKTDFFNINPDVPKEETLEEKFARERLEWSEKVDEMTKRVKPIFEIPELMTYLYTERQRAIEYYHYLISLIIGMNRKYNAAYMERQEYYTTKSQIRYPNEATKNIKIQVDLADMVEKRAAVDNHSKFMTQTISTVDNIIWAIPRRVEIEQIARGGK
jgi:hypothetical protein